MPNYPSDIMEIIRDLDRRVTRAERAAAGISNVSLGKGYVGFTALTANSGNITSEAIAATLASVPIEDGRAYEIGLKTYLWRFTTTTRVWPKIRKTNVTGSIYVNFHELPGNLAADTNQPFDQSRILVRTAGLGDETITFRFTLECPVGTTRIAASSTSSCGMFYIKDIGASVDFTGVNVIGA